MAGAGADLDALAGELEAAGLRAFEASYAEAIDHICRYVAGEGRGAAA